MRKLITLVLPLALVPAAAHASNGLQLIGFSLKQLGVGGAVTANPMTPVTAITNPAGLTYVSSQTEASLEAAFLNLKTHFNAAPGADSRSLKEFQLLPSLGLMAPTKNPNIKFGMAVAATAGSGTDFAWPALNRAASSSLQVIKIAPAVSFKVNDRMSVGVAGHINIGSVSLSNPGFGASTLPAAFAHVAETVGLGCGVGVMGDVIPGKLQLGASYQTATNFSDAKYGSATGEYRGKFNLPQQAAVGACYKANDKLSLSADLKWIDWSSKLKDLMIYGPGLPTEGVNLGTNWKNQYVLALGAQYKVAADVTLMAGFNHGDEPFNQQYTSRNIMTPAITRDHFTFGVIFESDDRWSLGAVAVYSPKRTITDGVTTISSQTFTVGLSATIKF